jgi:hypothetical protein
MLKFLIIQFLPFFECSAQELPSEVVNSTTSDLSSSNTFTLPVIAGVSVIAVATLFCYTDSFVSFYDMISGTNISGTFKTVGFFNFFESFKFGTVFDIFSWFKNFTNFGGTTNGSEEIIPTTTNSEAVNNEMLVSAEPNQEPVRLPLSLLEPVSNQVQEVNSVANQEQEQVPLPLPEPEQVVNQEQVANQEPLLEPVVNKEQVQKVNSAITVVNVDQSSSSSSSSSSTSSSSSDPAIGQEVSRVFTTESLHERFVNARNRIQVAFDAALKQNQETQEQAKFFVDEGLKSSNAKHKKYCETRAKEFYQISQKAQVNLITFDKGLRFLQNNNFQVLSNCPTALENLETVGTAYRNVTSCQNIDHLNFSASDTIFIETHNQLSNLCMQSYRIDAIAGLSESIKIAPRIKELIYQGQLIHFNPTSETGFLLEKDLIQIFPETPTYDLYIFNDLKNLYLNEFQAFKKYTGTDYSQYAVAVYNVHIADSKVSLPLKNHILTHPVIQEWLLDSLTEDRILDLYRNGLRLTDKPEFCDILNKNSKYKHLEPLQRSAFTNNVIQVLEMLPSRSRS